MGKNKAGTGKRISILLVFLLILLTASYTYAKTYVENNAIVLSQKYVDADEIIKEENNTNEILELKKNYNNNEIKGKLIIEGTSIEEPIVKHTDNDYYLHHNSKGEYEINGAIFADYRINLEDRKVLIFGHSSIYDDIPFNKLENYYKKSYYDNHKYIKVITENETYKYEIFSVYVETSDFTYMNLKIDDNTYNNDLKKYKNKSLYDTDVEVHDNDEIIILQTCSNSDRYKNYNKKFLLVIGRKVK